MPSSAPPPIHAWSPDDRPRERLRAVGARHLSARELVALLVGSGGSGGSAFHVADRLLASAGGSLRRLGTSDPGTLERVPGVGAATAARILAALELGRRSAAGAADEEEPIRGPADVFRRMGPRLRDLAQEEFHALLLNTRHKVIREVAITRGILDASLIHPREVFRLAVVEGAAGVIRTTLAMIYHELHLAGKLGGGDLWREIEKHLDMALVMIDSQILPEATFHLTRALSRVTTIGQRAMTVLKDQGLI